MRRVLLVLCLAAGGLPLATGTADAQEVSAHAGAAAVSFGDFNGDGYADLVVGVPGEDLNRKDDVGAVHVFYGGPRGIGTRGNKLFFQDFAFIQGDGEVGDGFGYSVAVGNFNADAFDDLAVGVPFEDVGSTKDAGAVNVIYGSANGLTAKGNQQLYQGGAVGDESAETEDRFGEVLAVGDFDKNGADDLAIGVPREDGLIAPALPIGSGTPVRDAGGVNIVYGAPPNGLGLRSEIWDQSVQGEADAVEAEDQFGAALAAGDFDGNGFDDLGIGVPFEDIGTFPDTGAVTVIFGGPQVPATIPILTSPTPAGLHPENAEFWHQDSENVNGLNEDSDIFGLSLAAGDFSGDGKDDLAVGIPGENFEGGPTDAGTVVVLNGMAPAGMDPGGLIGNANPVWSQDAPGVPGGSETGDFFGTSLAAADFNSDGVADLAVGLPFEDIGTRDDGGAVNVLYGTFGGLTGNGSQLFAQDAPGIKGGSEADDHFGFALGTGDFDGNGSFDVAVGVPGEGIGNAANAGAVNVIYGTGSKLNAADNQLWHQDTPGVFGGSEGADRFGWSIG